MFSFLEDWSEQDETHIFSFFLVPFPFLFFFSPSSFGDLPPLTSARPYPNQVSDLDGGPEQTLEILTSLLLHSTIVNLRVPVFSPATILFFADPGSGRRCPICI